MADSLAAYLARVQVTDDRIVSFDNKGLKLDNAQSAEEIVRAIETCPSMEVLNLAGNTLGVEAAQEIASALQSRPTLKFALWKDMYTGRLRSEIPLSLRALSSAMILAQTQLVELDLSDNAFGPDGAEAIRSLLTSPVAYTIQTLKFQNNGLGGGGVIIADCLMDNHARAQKQGRSLDLRTFIAGRNRLENHGAIALGAAFSLLGTLEQIEVIQNGIQYEGIQAIAECIKHSPNLKILNLNDNIMTPKGAISIAEALPFAGKLEILNLGDCLVKTEGALALAKYTKSLTCLKELVLSYNEIQTEGGEALAKTCCELKSLQKVDLDGNHFGDEGKATVGAALGSRLSLLDPGLNNDEGVPSDDEEEAEEKEEEEKEEKKDSPEKSKSEPQPFVFGGASTYTPTLGKTSDSNKAFGFGSTTEGFSFSSVAGENIFAKASDETDHTFKGTGKALFGASANNAAEVNPEQEPDVHFERLVTLEKVDVAANGDGQIGEELYKHRAKLFRFDKDNGAWKERGVGDIRILQNKQTKTSRLLMRRDLIFKICCNHQISKQMEMEPNAGSLKSLVWFTPADYTEGEPKPEQLAVRFKTPEICADFLKAFLKARDEIPEAGAVSAQEPAVEPSEAETSKPVEEPPKTEPFSFAALAANAEKAAFAAQSSPQKSSPVKDGSHREDEPDIHFERLVTLEQVEVRSGTENEETKYTHRCKLYRFDKDSAQWKERGLGDISVLWQKSTGKGRIIMRREILLKLCCNHLITEDMDISFHQGNDKFLTWHTYADISDEEPMFQQLAARFKTAEVAADFKKAVSECQANLGKVDTTEDPVAVSASKAIDSVKISEDVPKPEQRKTKPAAGGMSSLIEEQKTMWDCSTCALKNKKEAGKCIACETPNPAAAPAAVDNKAIDASAAPKFSFGVPSGTGLSTGGSTPAFGTAGPPQSGGFTFGTTSAPSGNAAPSATTTPSFSFGAPAPTSEAPKSGFTFGPPQPKPNAAPTFSFGQPAAEVPTFQFGTGRDPPTKTEKTPEKEEPKPSLFAGFSFGNVTKQETELISGVQTVGSPSSAQEETSIDYQEFVSEPTEAVLEQITSPERVGDAVDCSSACSVATFLGRLSRVMSNKTNNTTHKILDTVLAASFSQENPSVVTNELLVIMGLIKSEDKDFKPSSNVGNMLRLMSHAISQPYFPDASAKIVSAFVKKDKEVLSNKITDCTDLFTSFQI